MQVCGKLRGRIVIPSTLTREDALEFFSQDPEFTRLVGDAPIKKLIFVPGRLVNIVI